MKNSIIADYWTLSCSQFRMNSSSLWRPYPIWIQFHSSLDVTECHLCWSTNERRRGRRKPSTDESVVLKCNQKRLKNAFNHRAQEIFCCAAFSPYSWTRRRLKEIEIHSVGKGQSLGKMIAEGAFIWCSFYIILPPPPRFKFPFNSFSGDVLFGIQWCM